MIDRDHALSLTRQAKVLAISRGSIYYQPRPVSESGLALMKLIDRLHLDYPFAGARMLRDLLALRSIRVGRRHMRTLMRRMGIEALYRKPNTSKKHPTHRIYPYLLRHLKVELPNQVWAMDITYVPMARGFVYLAAVVDWRTRRVLSCHGVCPSPWTCSFVWMRCRKLSTDMARRRYSIPTKAANSPALSLPTY